MLKTVGMVDGAVSLAEDGEGALAILKESPIPLVLLDLQMPFMVRMPASLRLESHQIYRSTLAPQHAHPITEGRRGDSWLTEL